MKKFIFIFLSLLFFMPKPTTAKAEQIKYSQITSQDVMLYIDSSLTIEWFVLPVGYYVKVLSVSHSSAKVEYKSDNPSKPSVKGYVLAEHLNVVDQTPTVLYPSLVLTLNQNCMLYKDVDMTLFETITQGSTIDYYGQLKKADGQTYIYGFVTTSSGDKYVGYLPSTAVYDFTPPSLPIESLVESVESVSIQNESQPVKNGLGNTLQLVVIIAVSVISISIVYLLFKPSPTKASDEVITDDDYYDE